MTVTYYATTQREPPLLLRRAKTAAGITDEAFVGGVWQPTKIIVDYMFGHDDFVHQITEAQARRLRHQPGERGRGRRCVLRRR